MQCVVSMQKRCVIDGMMPNGRTKISGETLDEVRLRYPDANIMEAKDAVRALEDAMISTEAREITREEFTNALYTLPPKNWHSKGNIESFMMIEHFSYDVTSVYLRDGDKYYTFLERSSLKFDEVVDKYKALPVVSLDRQAQIQRELDEVHGHQNRLEAARKKRIRKCAKRIRESRRVVTH